MAEQKNHTLLYVGLAGIAGLLLFKWWENQQGATTTTTTTSTTATDAVTATTAPAGFSQNGAVEWWFNTLSGYDQAIMAQVLNSLSSSDQAGLLSFIAYLQLPAPRPALDATDQVWLNQFTAKYGIYSGK